MSITRTGILARAKFVLVVCGMPIAYSIFGAIDSNNYLRAAEFEELGILPDRVASTVNGISDDGTVIVGDSFDGQVPRRSEAFRWSTNGELEGLGFLPGDVQSRATAVSGDGSTIVGVSMTGSTINFTPFEWTASDGLELLPNAQLDGGNLFPTGISGDGNVVVGYADGSGCLAACVSLWTEAGGVVGYPFDGVVFDFAEGTALSDYVLAGWGGVTRAAAYTGLTERTFLTSGQGTAFGITANGETVYGVFNQHNPQPGAATGIFSWSETTGLSDLGLPDGHSLIATQDYPGDVSADGKLAAITLLDGDDAEQPFLWSEDLGFRALEDLMINHFDLAAELMDWDLQRVSAISADGLTIAGHGLNPAGQQEAWRAVLPQQLLLPGDADGNGTVALPDFNILKANFGGLGKIADGDFNLDGVVSLTDFNILKGNFGASAGTSAAVPEPSTAVLLLAGGGLLIFIRRTMNI